MAQVEVERRRRARRRLLAALAASALGAGASRAAAQADPPPAQPVGWTFHGTVDAAYVSATGNSQITTGSLGDKLALARGNWTLRQNAAYVYGKTDGTESANQLRAGVRAEYRLTSRFSAFAGANYERNPYAGFSRRLDELFGAQWRALAAPSDSVTISVGGLYTLQSNTDGTTSDSPSGHLAMWYKHIFRPNTFFSQSVDYIPDLTQPGERRTNAESILSAPLTSLVSLRLSYLMQYNSQPPAGFRTTDRIFTSGLQVAF
ncbi:MAG: DUF481 domain-containing protein [Gemmatimonadaceae bacterium]|nr:DUF481 domain-containing protein [Gemmatimonadaceae bacterium]